MSNAAPLRYGWRVAPPAATALKLTPAGRRIIRLERWLPAIGF
jgi:hypothetical protein